MDVRLDGRLLGRFETAGGLKTGRSFRLADGSMIEVKLVGAESTSELRVTRGGDPVPEADAGTGAPGAPVARSLSAEDERRRLELLQVAAAPATTAAVGRGRVEIRSKLDVDAAASGLRFVAHRLEITPQGLKASYPDGRTREVSFAEVASVVVRLLPPDPPWNAHPLLDAVILVPDATAWTAIRIFSTTVVNYAAVPGGPSTSRLENTRRLGAHLVAQNPQMVVDEETRAFLLDSKPASRFVNTSHFAEYDRRYR